MFETLLISAIQTQEVQKEQLKPHLVLQTAGIIQNNERALSIGGRLGVESELFLGVSAQVEMFTSQKVPYVNPTGSALNGVFFDSDKESFSYVGLASLNYTSDALNAKVGYIELETPFADIDDYRMLVNTFQGFKIGYALNDVTLSLFGANAWAGFDSGDSIDVYKEIATNSLGFLATSAEWAVAENQNMTLWYYYVSNMAHLAYADYAYTHTFETGAELSFTAEAVGMKEVADSGVSGVVAGVATSVTHKGVIISASYEYALVGAGKSITNGFGGGPYLTSMDESTIATISQAYSGNDIGAIMLGCSYTGIEGLEFGYAYVLHDAVETNANVIEHNLGGTYAIDEQLNAQVMLVNYSDYVANSVINSFNRVFARLDYTY